MGSWVRLDCCSFVSLAVQFARFSGSCGSAVRAVQSPGSSLSVRFARFGGSCGSQCSVLERFSSSGSGSFRGHPDRDIYKYIYICICICICILCICTCVLIFIVSRSTGLQNGLLLNISWLPIIVLIKSSQIEENLMKTCPN